MNWGQKKFEPLKPYVIMEPYNDRGEPAVSYRWPIEFEE